MEKEIEQPAAKGAVITEVEMPSKEEFLERFERS